MKLKTILFIIALVGMFTWGNINYFSKRIEAGEPFTEITGSKCGTILDNFTSLTNVKHGTTTDYYWKIQYDDGSIIVESISDKSWYYKKVGDRTCFLITEQLSLLYVIIFILDIILALFIGLLGIIIIFRYFFNCKPYNPLYITD